MKRSSFTVVELLVVIATVSLLMAILLPAMRSVRQQSRNVLCSSNIKQLTLALLMYETQNGMLPYSFQDKRDASGKLVAPPGGYAGNGAIDMQGWWWFNFIEGFYRRSDRSTKRTVVLCPSRKITPSRIKEDALCGNYGVNRSVCKNSYDRQSGRGVFKGQPLNTGEIAKPDRTLLIVDSGYAMISWWNVTKDPPVVLNSTYIEDTAYIPGLEIVNKDKDLWSGQEEDAISGRHPQKRVNIGFADGRISRKKAYDLLVEKMEDGSYENKSPLWVPE